MDRAFRFFLSYHFILFFYVFYYLIISYFSNEFDSLHFYEIVLKVNSGDILYADYNVWYGPHLIFFLNFLKLLNLTNYNFYIFLGLIQNIVLAYIIFKINNHFYNDKALSKSVFVLGLFCINPMVNNFYWDYYALIFFFTSFYYYLKNDYLKSGFFGSFIFFLKQTQGVFFIFFILFLFFYDLLFKKKNIKNYLIYFLIFSLFQFIIIGMFYDINDYLYNSIYFIFGYSESLFGSKLQTIALIILKSSFLQVDQITIFSKDFFRHKTLILFYLIFILGFHLWAISFILKLKRNILSEKFIYFFFIFVVSCLMTSLIGRGYLSKIFIIFIFTLDLIYNNKYLYEKLYKKILFSYTILSIIFISLISLKNFNNEFIRYENNKFLSIPKSFFQDQDLYNSTKDLKNYIYKKKLENIFVFGNSSRLAVILNNIPTMNYNLYFYITWQPSEILEFKNKLFNDLKTKQPKTLIYSNKERKTFIKNNKNIEKELEFYKTIYNNKIFSVLERIK